MNTFTTLPKTVKLQIDEAFDLACANGEPDNWPPRKKRRLREAPVEDTHAGFILDDSDDQQGGFILGDDNENQPPDSPGSAASPSSTAPTHIPMSCIPAALQLLDLQPDDPEVLAVFRNAASGWTSRSIHDMRHDSPDERDRERTVGRDDWRAVCAVLLDPNVGEPDEGQGDVERLQQDSGDKSESDNDPDSDEYQYEDEPFAEESSADDTGSDEEYLDEPQSGKSRNKLKTSRKTALVSSSPPPSNDTPGKFTSRQALECRRAFALFFPDITVDSSELDGQKIMIKDITRVAKLLNEKVKAEEVRV
jgi:hypothetical protein